MLFSSRKLQH